MSKRDLLIRNELGFFEVKEKPDAIELEEYYSIPGSIIKAARGIIVLGTLMKS